MVGYKLVHKMNTDWGRQCDGAQGCRSICHTHGAKGSLWPPPQYAPRTPGNCRSGVCVFPLDTLCPIMTGPNRSMYPTFLSRVGGWKFWFPAQDKVLSQNGLRMFDEDNICCAKGSNIHNTLQHVYTLSPRQWQQITCDPRKDKTPRAPLSMGAHSQDPKSPPSMGAHAPGPQEPPEHGSSHTRTPRAPLWIGSSHARTPRAPSH